MQPKVPAAEEYIASLPEDLKEPVENLRKVILNNLSEGFAEEMANGMLAYYVVPYELIGELASKMIPAEWISLYEKQVKR